MRSRSWRLVGAIAIASLAGACAGGSATPSIAPAATSPSASAEARDWVRDIDVGGRTFRQYLGVEGIVALFGKHGRDTLAPDLLHSRKDAQFVVDQDIVIGRIETPHIVELLLLVDVNEDAVVE